ncbi:hypothetical protein LT330_006338 [Penicillium expansum]|nr:hypothetical protein LT330_006338 [Penicillium expansum]
MVDATQSSQGGNSSASSSLANEAAAVTTTTTSSSLANEAAAVTTTTTSSSLANGATAVTTTTTSSSSTNVGPSMETTSLLQSVIPTQPTSNSAARTPSSVANPSHIPTNRTVTPVSLQSNGSFTSGTLAGAIVGAFAGGCILALLAAFLFFYFRKKSLQPREKGPGSSFVGENTGKVSGQTITTFAGSSTTKSETPLPPVATAFESQYLDLSRYIPQPADDNSVCMRIQSLFDQAGLHVENYYSRTTSNPALTQDSLARLSHYDSISLPTSLITMLSNPRSQRAVLTHVLVESLLRAIQPGETEGSLLPAIYAKSPQKRGSEMRDTATDRAEFAWRMLTSFLYDSPTLPRGDIRKFAEEFTKTFEAYRNSQFAEADRLRHLVTISKSAADLGVWLFLQPCSFKFRWTTDGVSDNKLVVLPAVIKVYDEHGRRLAVPETLVKEETVQT